MTRIKGRITDSQTNEPLPFVNINFVGKTIGTTTDFNGDYSLETMWGSNQIHISYIGYESEVRNVDLGKSQVINIKLKTKSTELKEVTIVGSRKYRNKDNPAVGLIRKVIEHKSKNRKEGFDYFSYDKYEKVEFDLNNITDKFRKSRVMKKFQFVFNYVDTSEINGKPYLPLWIKETKARVYYRKEPRNYKEHVYASKQVGFEGYVDDEGIGSYINNLYQDINIYDNNITLLTVQFNSPIATLAPQFYKYFIVDTVPVNGVPCINLAFTPRTKEDFAFTGNMFITLDSSYAVKKINMTIPKEINLNWVQGLNIEQEFDSVSTQGLMLSRDMIAIDFNLTKKGKGLMGKKTVTYRDYEINKPLPDQIFKGTERIIVEDSASERDNQFWAENRHEKLTKSEVGIYEMIDSVKNIPAFRRTMDLLFFLLSGYKDFGPVSIGPVNTFYSWNELEGFRGRFGMMTTPSFSNKIAWETFAAWGSRKSYNGKEYSFNDRFKHFNSVKYTFNKNCIVYPYNHIQVSYQHDLEIPGRELQFVSEDNFLLSFKRGINDKMFFNDLVQIEYLKERSSGFTTDFILKRINQRPFGNIDFSYVDSGEPRSIPSINRSEAIVTLRFAPNEKFYQGKAYRIPIFTKYPIFTLTGIFGFKDVLESDYTYQSVQFGFFKRIYLAPIGFGDLNLDAGKVFGRVPYPMLVFHKANQTYSYQLESYNLMNFMEFISDQYVAINYQHFMNGLILNRIPLLRKLELREVGSVKVLWGTVTSTNSPKNHPADLFMFPRELNGQPSTFTLASKPYIEVSAGIGNVLKFFRIEVIKRLTYLDNPNVSDIGIRGRFKFDF
ncbi:MAG: DUF5686 and carboxypeptidase regulatory-like domain-containing protein [Bacteroidia bacterium]|nr:carboxypeptidase-like regulatory domain-containing protein [Bacteroidia bacterium]MCZ2277779.1 DUF5686 and carboxypeptidase regulatory-like domain-containing protein [Bacteroidia bacterium]